MTHYRFRRRRLRDYPLPTRGMKHAGLTEVLPRRDIRHAATAGELLSPGHGLYTPPREGAPAQHLATLEALCRGGPHLISHHTAASLWGITEEELGPPFHMTAPADGSRIKRPGLVTAHRSHVPEADRFELQDLPVTGAARTWVDIALCSPLFEAVIYADRCRRIGRPEYGEDLRPLASGHELEAALHRRGRTRGVVNARRALTLSRDGVDSPQETRLRLYMDRAGLPQPLVNAWICDDYERPVVQPDLTIWEYRIAIQYEGWEYHADRDQMAKDIRRQERTEAQGWIEVRITREHMRNAGAQAVQKIRQALFRQGWRP